MVEAERIELSFNGLERRALVQSGTPRIEVVAVVGFEPTGFPDS